jgi:hypothetical protein
MGASLPKSPACSCLADPQPTGASRGAGGAVDADMADRAVAELVCQALEELGGHEAHLGGPGGRVGGDGQLAGLERLRLRVEGQLGADDVRPVAEDGPDCCPFAPASRRQEATDGGSQGLRIVPPRPRRPRRRRGACRRKPNSFWILGLALSAVTGTWAISPRPRIGPGARQGIGSQPGALRVRPHRGPRRSVRPRLEVRWRRPAGWPTRAGRPRSGCRRRP